MTRFTTVIGTTAEDESLSAVNTRVVHVFATRFKPGVEVTGTQLIYELERSFF